MSSNPDENSNKVARPLSDAARLLDVAFDCSRVVGPHKLNLPLARDAGKLAFTVENVLTPLECMRLIDASEAEGFVAAGLGRTGEQSVATQFRDSGRLITEDFFLASKFFTRVQPFLPVVWQGRRILGLNEQLKFLRYNPGQKFVAHYDGAFCRPNTKNKTCLTLQLYLTQDRIEGGATRFVDHDGGNPVSCEPIGGRALVFQHNILHDGEEVKEGVKYTIRTDVEYGSECASARLQEILGLGVSPSDLRRRLKKCVIGFVAIVGTLIEVWLIVWLCFSQDVQPHD